MQAASLEYINLDEENVTNTGRGKANQKIYKSLTPPGVKLTTFQVSEQCYM
jgi:hypothetical protein